MTESALTPALIVAIGASAGGLSALQELFRELPAAPTGMAFVIVQHLSPDHKSLMSEILGRLTSLPIRIVQDGDRLRPDTIYLNAPAAYLTCQEECLRVSRQERHLHLPIDHFFESLARDCGDRCVAVVLSGTGSDGSRGLLAVKEAGGLVMVQDEVTAEYAGMPCAAMATGAVDYVLRPGQLARELVAYRRHYATTGARLQQATEGEQIASILSVLRDKVGIDFAEYKKETLTRRIRRRMAVRQSDSLSAYGSLLRADSHEAKLLLRDVLIGVTRFFRDADAFDCLAQRVIPALFDARGPDEPLRVWVPGCSTGEEAYSIGILFLEHAARLGVEANLKIFATDLDRDALQIASKGFYPETIAEDVSASRLQQYFTAQPGGYQIAPELRDPVVFSPHNVVADPPFTRLDMVSCRNLMIYFEATLQKRALSFLHFALKPARFLFLGSGELPGELQDGFLTTDLKQKVFQKLSLSPSLYRWPSRASYRALTSNSDSKNELSLAVDLGYRCLLEQYCPAAILVDASGTLVHTLVAADRYVKTHPGPARLELTSLLSGRLSAVVTTAINRNLRHGASSSADLSDEEKEGREFVVLEGEDGPLVGVKVSPLPDTHGTPRYAMVTFREIQPAPDTTLRITDLQIEEETQHQLQQLRQEAQLARQNFQTTVEELETTIEELQATNEELQASAQEYATTSEQLRRDLLAVHQELCTLTSDHSDRVEELTELNSDMQNFLDSSRQAVIFLNEALCVRRCTPSAARYINVRESDVGRPVAHFSLNFHGRTFLEDARSVAENGRPIERLEWSSDQKESFRISVHPYVCAPGKRGVVVTFRETDDARQRGGIAAVLDAFDDPVALLNRDGEILWTNDAWPPAKEGEPWLGRRWADTMEAASEVARAVEKALRDGVSEISRWSYQRPSDGRSFQIKLAPVWEGLDQAMLIQREVAGLATPR